MVACARTYASRIPTIITHWLNRYLFLCSFKFFGSSKVTEISRISAVMYVSNQFIDGKLFSFSLAGLAASWYKTWVLCGHDLKTTIQQLRPKFDQNAKNALALLANECQTKKHLKRAGKLGDADIYCRLPLVPHSLSNVSSNVLWVS